MDLKPADVEASRLTITGGRITAHPPALKPARAIVELVTTHPHLWASTFDPPLRALKIQQPLKDGRGRAIVARSLLDDGGPLCALAWHLDKDLTVCPLVLTVGRRIVGEDTDPRIMIARDLALRAVLDLMLWVSACHCHWALGLLSPKQAERAHHLGALEFDVEGQPAVADLVNDVFVGQAKLARTTPSGVTRLRVNP